MRQLTQGEATLIVDDYLTKAVLPKAEEMTRADFCQDCPGKTDNCFPCKTATTMIRLYGMAILAQAARLN